MPSSSPVCFVRHHPLVFAGQTLRQFQANQGFLLAGAIAYYAMQ